MHRGARLGVNQGEAEGVYDCTRPRMSPQICSQDCPKNKKHHILTPARAHFTPSHLHAPEALFTQSAFR